MSSQVAGIHLNSQVKAGKILMDLLKVIKSLYASLTCYFCNFGKISRQSMKTEIFIIILALCFTSPDFGQKNNQPLNQTDNLGRKQGHWIKKYPNGNLLYDGYFRNDSPVGEFKRYYETGPLKSDLIFSPSGKEAIATLYYQNGFKASSGKYVNQLKEGKWKFFSAFTEGFLISEEEYSLDKRNGLAVNYYPDSTVAEKINYTADIRNGEWTKYHPSGSLHMRTIFRNGRLDGIFEAFFENGRPEVTGQYRNDIKEGLWTVYKKDGTIKFRTEYLSGMPQNNGIDIYESNYIDSLEKVRITIPDPEKTGQIW